MAGVKASKKFFVLLFILVGLIVMAGWGIGFMVRYSATSSSVCQSCHPEHNDLWVRSNGHPSDQTSCHECHYRKPEALFQDGKFLENIRDWVVPPEYLADDPLTSGLCLFCHPEVLTLGYRVKKQVIQFNHRIHHDEGLDCLDCHRSAGHDYMKNTTNRPGIRECLDCHRKEFEGPPKNLKCLNCHQVMLAPGRVVFEENQFENLQDKND